MLKWIGRLSIAAGTLTIAFAFVKDFGSVRGESRDPSQRATVVEGDGPRPGTGLTKAIGGVLIVAGVVLLVVGKKR